MAFIIIRLRGRAERLRCGTEPSWQHVAVCSIFKGKLCSRNIMYQCISHVMGSLCLTSVAMRVYSRPSSCNRLAGRSTLSMLHFFGHSFLVFLLHLFHSTLSIGVCRFWLLIEKCGAEVPLQIAQAHARCETLFFQICSQQPPKPCTFH